MADKEYHVVIPEERFTLIRSSKKELPAVISVNSALYGFEPKIIFRWHLSILFTLKDQIGNGMPTKEETDLLYAYEDQLSATLRGPRAEKPNALFLATITWNGTREVLYRVYDPEPANDALQQICRENSTPRGFDFTMEPDPEWKSAEWLLEATQQPIQSATDNDGAAPRRV